MATPYTLTLREAETRLRDLVGQVQIARQPVILTTEETAEPIVVLMTADEYEASQRQGRLLFDRQLDYLTNLLAELSLTDADQVTKRNTRLVALRKGLSVLFSVSSGQHQSLTAMLELAARRLSPADVSDDQIAALRKGIETLRRPLLTETDIEDCYTSLLDSGIPPGLTYDDAMVELYVGES